MRVDIYKRAEHHGQFTYLAVPEGKIIPEEAINTDWELSERGIDVEDNATHLPDFSIDAPHEQIRAKGYAITSVKELADK
ncbi:hypothetical protein GCM10007205_05930 [Oxalicibacterium flavum]|uniref:Uncharacterized protein n=1 Tax=Oxalicibacterium flavum TaxID=179467 RepID=A0A8J2UJU1_9BURK|nr:DUF6139 family protein [Oxalicibacterium flavum]GGB99419.1 hypothetical protein GCM10007205_05930 [Oxalicibacterium flavum]